MNATAINTTTAPATTAHTTTTPATGASTPSANKPSASTASANVSVGIIDTQVGRLRVAVTEVGLAAVDWCDDSELAPLDLDQPITEPAAAAVEQLQEYFAGGRTTFDLPIDWGRTTRTQQAVLKTLHETVPTGETITYGELARRSGTGIPPRGIGSIMGSNPVPLVVACHRVLASDGLGGYSGGRHGNGLEVKRWLLTFEGALPPPLGWDPTIAIA